MIIDLKDILLSSLRWSIGLSIGGLLGLFLASLNNFKYINRPFKLIVDFFRAIPVIGIVPIIQMNIGVNEFGKIGLIAWAVMFPVWITISSTIGKTHENAELSLISFSRSVFFRVYTMPKLIGGFLKGIELGIGIAWLAVVAAEWVGTFSSGFWSGGLGYKLIVGTDQDNWEMVYANLLTFGILGLLSAYIWRLSIRLMLKKIKFFNPLLA